MRVAVTGLVAVLCIACEGRTPDRAEMEAAPVEAPPGMVYVPGGTTRIGSEEGRPEEQPVFRARVAPFFMDARLVTVAEFRAFVDSTGYVTDAERLGDAGVLDMRTGHWTLVRGAHWRRPRGPSAPPAEDDHPVTQVSWNDAAAYARWAGKRLPTEVEWEHAARGARDARERYSWGGSAAPDGRVQANVGEGLAGAPASASSRDGYRYTSPVGTFGTTALGLSDMGGNVWQWTADWFRSYAERDEPYTPGPASERVQRGGSFLCDSLICHGYRVSARSHSTPETALFNVGFRLVKDVPR